MPVQVDSLPQPGGGGGGYVQHLDFDPTVVNRLVAAGDNWGPVLSLDGGATWNRKARGLYSNLQFQVASVLFSTFTTSKVLLGTQDGIMESNDGGLSWSKLTG